VPIDDKSWQDLEAAARAVGVKQDAFDALLR
jgi:hypothetical protein